MSETYEKLKAHMLKHSPKNDISLNPFHDEILQAFDFICNEIDNIKNRIDSFSTGSQTNSQPNYDYTEPEWVIKYQRLQKFIGAKVCVNHTDYKFVDTIADVNPRYIIFDKHIGGIPLMDNFSIEEIE